MYLPSLRERYKYVHDQQKNVVFRPPEIGEIVMVEEKYSKNRFDWRLGKVVEINRSEDGSIRNAKVKTAKSVISRPINLLYPL